MQPTQPNPSAPSQPSGVHASSTRNDGLRDVLFVIMILIAAPLVALLLTAFVFQSYQVDGPSMQTTLQNQDRLLVLKVPRTISRITGNDYIPNRGDVIVFVKHNIQDFSDGESDKQLIKRVIALPGERVVVRDGEMKVYNKQYPNGFSPDRTSEYGSVIDQTPGDIDVTVPEGKVFVSGDNRFNSLDSRVFGPIDSHDIVGKLIIRIYPINKAKLF